MDILLVDDNETDRLLMARELRRELAGATVVEVGASGEFDEALRRPGYDAAVIDYALGWARGTELLPRIKVCYPGCAVVMVSGVVGEDVAVEAMKAGLDDYLMKKGGWHGLLGATVAQNVARKQRINASLVAPELYVRLFDRVPVGVCHCTPDGIILEANPTFSHLVHAGTARGHALSEYIHGDIGDLMIGSAAVEVQVRGEENGWLLAKLQKVQSSGGGLQSFECVFAEITQQKRTQFNLETTIKEKEILLHELYHRVNNNLQVILTFIQGAGPRMHDDADRQVLLEVASRVRSIAMMQDQLYRSGDLTRVDLGAYLRLLARTMTEGIDVTATVDVVPLSVPVDKAISLGLAANEIILNCLKHAFRGVEHPRIDIILRPLSDDEALLTIHDNGVGFVVGAAPTHRHGGFGMKMIGALARQAKATLDISMDTGTRITLRFPISSMANQ
ncbi:MAG: response regulator [Alphaproteobacteria bacterium]